MNIRLVLPQHLRTLAGVGSEITIDVEGPATVRSVLETLESRYPVLRGTIRDHGTLKRRPFLRFFACEEDLSLESPDTVLPERVRSGAEPFYIIGAIAGGDDGPLPLASPSTSASIGSGPALTAASPVSTRRR